MANRRFEQISTIALESMYSRGYEGMTLRALAREVGMQVPSLYNYFASKQELLYRLMHVIMEDLLRVMREALEGSGSRPDERLRAAIRAFVTFNLHHPHEAAVSDAEFRSLSPENRCRIVQLRDEFESIFDAIIDEGQDQGIFIPLNPRVTGKLSPEEVAAIMADYLLRGLLVSPPVTSNPTSWRNPGV